MLVTVLIVMSGTAIAQAPKAAQPPSEEKKETTSAVSLAELVPLATQLEERSAALENKLGSVFDVSPSNLRH